MIVPLTAFVGSSECPFTSRQLRRRIYDAKPMRDTGGRVLAAGDQLLLRAIIQPGGPNGPMFIDTEVFAQWLDSHRLAGAS